METHGKISFVLYEGRNANGEAIDPGLVVDVELENVKVLHYDVKREVYKVTTEEGDSYLIPSGRCSGKISFEYLSEKNKEEWEHFKKTHNISEQKVVAWCSQGPPKKEDLPSNNT